MQEEGQEAQRESPAAPGVHWRSTRTGEGRSRAGDGVSSAGTVQGEGAGPTPLARTSSLSDKVGAMVGRGVRALVRGKSERDGSERQGEGHKERSM